MAPRELKELKSQIKDLVGKGLIKQGLVPFLGHIVSSLGIEVDMKKMEAVKNCPRHVTPINMQSFLALA